MIITIIKAYQQLTIILTGQNTIPMLLVTTVNVLAIFKRSVGPRNKISRIKKNLEIILTITAIFVVIREFFIHCTRYSPPSKCTHFHYLDH